MIDGSDCGCDPRSESDLDVLDLIRWEGEGGALASGSQLASHAEDADEVDLAYAESVTLQQA
jgi:hypothetical protein